MRTALYALCALLWIAGGLTFVTATSVVVQIIGCILGLSGTIMFVGGAVVGAIEDLKDSLKVKQE